ncbi:hypothetical protein ColTof4_10903 [Colletotrichum tofieldiae]|nr:hypothetical protein ColTof4_10903 [Colletotrichum tofieldiae]
MLRAERPRVMDSGVPTLRRLPAPVASLFKAGDAVTCIRVTEEQSRTLANDWAKSGVKPDVRMSR